VQQLQRDGRMGYQALGRAVGLARTAARARVQHLLDRQVIRIVAVTDTVVAGRPVMAHVSADVTGSALAAARAVAGLPSATFVAATAGEFAVVAELRTADDDELAAELDRLRALPGIVAINVVRTLVIVRDAYRNRRGGAITALDTIDRQIVTALECDGRMPYAKLGPLAGLSPAAARTRVLRLTRSGVVTVTALVAPSFSGRLARSGIGVTVGGPVAGIAEQVAELPDVTYVTTGTGRFDLIAAADATSETSLLATIDAIRRLPSVRRVQAWRHLEIVKERYAQLSLPPLDTRLRGG
jgi:DNA-binding Lrp family transcriptional regulator